MFTLPCRGRVGCALDETDCRPWSLSHVSWHLGVNHQHGSHSSLFRHPPVPTTATPCTHNTLSFIFAQSAGLKLFTLLKRGLINATRNWVYYWVRIAMFCALAVLSGIPPPSPHYIPNCETPPTHRCPAHPCNTSSRCTTELAAAVEVVFSRISMQRPSSRAGNRDSGQPQPVGRSVH